MGLDIGMPNSVAPANAGTYVLQGDFESAKKEIKEAFIDVKAMINSGGTGGLGGLTDKVDKTIM
jgi:hypothetical protein